MKTILITLAALTMMLHPLSALTNDGENSDTVVIELNNKSKILIYTQDKSDLKDLQQYDINKMIKDLNSALGSKKIEKIELEDENGKKYMKDTTIIIGDGGAKTKVKIGNMEFLVDVDDWDEFEDEWDEDLPVKKYDYIQEADKIDRTKHYFNIDFGLTNWLEGGSEFPDADGQLYTAHPWKSNYFALNSVNRTWIGGPLFLDWGGGISWYNWKMQDADVQINKGDDRIEFAEAPSDISGIKSKLTAPYVNVMMVPMLDFGQGRKKVKNLERGSVSFRTYKKQGLRFGVGGYAGYRTRWKNEICLQRRRQPPKG